MGQSGRPRPRGIRETTGGVPPGGTLRLGGRLLRPGHASHATRPATTRNATISAIIARYAVKVTRSCRFISGLAVTGFRVGSASGGWATGAGALSSHVCVASPISAASATVLARRVSTSPLRSTVPQIGDLCGANLKCLVYHPRRRVRDQR
jgi:hypothetical protein